MKDRNFLHNMYNETCTFDEFGEPENYDTWLERQLLSRIETIEQLELSLVSNQRELLLAYESYWRKQLGINEQEGDKILIEDFLANNCG